MRKYTCHDCGAKEGELHQTGCDMERCPFCGGQLISCDCVYKLLNIDNSKGTWAYEHGLTNEQSQQWDKLLKAKGLIPYIVVPLRCKICGEEWPNFFGVEDDIWKKYVIPELQHEILCKPCYNHQVKLFPNGWRNAKLVKEPVGV
jgi:hypothetical protein